MTHRILCVFAIFISIHGGSAAADLEAKGTTAFLETTPHAAASGRVAVVDGQTLWFPADRMLVRMSDIDTCDLVQWSFDPNATPVTAPSLAPVPCGALAKAWLKRAIGSHSVHCDLVSGGFNAELTARCRIGRRDLALEMLRVGWARLSAAAPHDWRYVQAQQSAIAARYGMWGTYVLDMQQWRGKAIDRTLGRRPPADINLLKERTSEISPHFLDARRQPPRRDR